MNIAAIQYRIENIYWRNVEDGSVLLLEDRLHYEQRLAEQGVREGIRFEESMPLGITYQVFEKDELPMIRIHKQTFLIHTNLAELLILIGDGNEILRYEKTDETDPFVAPFRKNRLRIVQ